MKSFICKTCKEEFVKPILIVPGGAIAKGYCSSGCEHFKSKAVQP